MLEGSTTNVGRLVCCSCGDTDGDGVPDYADWCHNHHFVKAVLDVSKVEAAVDYELARVKFAYSASDPGAVTVQVVTNGGVVTTKYTPAEGAMRLWTVDSTTERNTNSVAEGGHWIPPNVPLRYAQVFGSAAVQVVDLYIEGVNPCTATGGCIRAEFAPLGGLYLPDEVHVTVLKVDLDADTDRDGDIDDDDETGEETHSLTRGTLVSPSLRALAATQNDITGLATLKINTQPTDPITGLTLKLKKTYEASGCTLHFLKTNGEKLPDIGNGQSYSLADWPTNTITLAVMPQYARPLTTSTWPIRFDLELQAVDANANVVCHDTVRLKVAPMILPPECNRPQKIYTTTIEGIPGATSMDATDAQVWAQDMVKFVKYQIADGQTGEMFVDLEHYAKGSFPDKLRSDEDWDGINVWSVDMLGDGGNIMVTPSLPDAPFGKLLIGSAKAGKPDPLTYWEGQGVQPTVRITVDWLMVGHVDEILMWVASDKVLYADPWKAADLLHQEIAAGHQTNSLWFGFDAAGTNKTIQQVVIAPSGVGFKLTTLPLPGLSNSSSPATLVFSNTIFVADDVLRVDDEILKVTSANGPTVTVARAQAARPAAAHATGSVIYAYTAVMKDNLPVDQAGVSVVEKIAIATNQLRQAMGSYSAAFVPMPVIFEYTTSEGVSGYAAKSANVVNCLLSTGGTICYSATGCTVFRNYISSVLPAAQEVFGGWEGLHCNYGEIHCATAAQRELDLAEPWWEQLDDWE